MRNCIFKMLLSESVTTSLVLNVQIYIYRRKMHHWIIQIIPAHIGWYFLVKSPAFHRQLHTTNGFRSQPCPMYAVPWRDSFRILCFSWPSQMEQSTQLMANRRSNSRFRSSLCLCMLRRAQMRLALPLGRHQNTLSEDCVEDLLPLWF